MCHPPGVYLVLVYFSLLSSIVGGIYHFYYQRLQFFGFRDRLTIFDGTSTPRLRGHVEACQWLLSAKADASAITKKKATILHLVTRLHEWVSLTHTSKLGLAYSLYMNGFVFMVN